jgi:UDP-3-O-[3-hydroxymyristoyl] glucosamine N-acyltransferase
MKLGVIAERLGCRLNGPGDLEIRGLSGIEDAQAHDLTFLSNPKYVKQLRSTRAGAIILSSDAPATELPSLVSENPYLDFARAIELFYQPPRAAPGIHSTAVVADTAQLGAGHSIGANVVIGEHVKIGKGATIYPNVTIYPHVRIGDYFVAHSGASVREHCRIGDRVILQNGAVVGGDGFGFAPRADRSYYKIVQSGIVVLEDDVELGANACVDRATIGETRIGRGTKVDNLVQVGHGCRVGHDNVLAAQVGLAGSTRVENHVMLAGQVGAAGHLTIGDDVIATAQTGIARSVPAGARISGTPEMDSNLWKKNYLLMHEFPTMVRIVKQLQKEVEELKAESG